MELYQLTKRDGSNLGQPMTGEQINETLLAALEEIEQLKNPWISVEDELPDDFGWFLVFDNYMPTGYEKTIGFFEGKESQVLWLPLDSRDEPESMMVTQWMTIPKLEGKGDE